MATDTHAQPSIGRERIRQVSGGWHMKNIPSTSTMASQCTPHRYMEYRYVPSDLQRKIPQTAGWRTSSFPPAEQESCLWLCNRKTLSMLLATGDRTQHDPGRGGAVPNHGIWKHPQSAAGYPDLGV